MPKPAPKPVAGITTVYRKWSHAEIILGKIVEGYLHDGKDGPNLKLVSLYIDQFSDQDTGRALCEKYGIRLCKTIDEAVTLGTDQLAVEGVVIVGEHGTYPANEKGQVLFPRRRFFDETAAAFDRVKKSVPVFNDKHLAAEWKDAKAMYDGAKKRFVPMLAGSSVPHTWRRPELELPIGCEIEAAVGIGYGPFEAYGFHSIEGLQCMVERRKGGETGVKSVEVLFGTDVWDAMDQGRFSKEVFEAGLEAIPAKNKGEYRTVTTRNKGRGAAAMFIEYVDGLTAAVILANGLMRDDQGGGFGFGAKLKGEAKPRACQFYLQELDPFGHFIYLVKAIDSLIQTGHSPIPVERTLLTSGILDAAMTSQHEKGKRIETPHLASIAYLPSRWPFAKDPVPALIPRKK